MTMKIPISLLLYKIKQKTPSAISRILQDVSVERPIFPDKQEKNKIHIVVVEHSMIQQFVAHSSYPLVVYIGAEEGVLQNVSCNYILYPASYSVSRVFNELTEIFGIFESWYQELEDAVNQYFSYNAIINSCDIFINVPIALVDTQFKYVCYSKRLAALCGYDKYVRNSIYLPLEDINYLNSLPDYKELEQKKEVFHYIAVENLLHKNIFYQDEFVARLSIPYVDDPLDNKCYMCLLDILAEYIERLYSRYGTFRRLEKQDVVLKELLVKILDGQHVEKIQLKKLLQDKGFEKTHQYMLVRFTSVFTNNNEDTSLALARRLEMQSPAVICIQYRKQIVALVNVTLYERLSDTSFLQQLSYYLRDSLLQAGISRQFHDFHDLPVAYKQTEIAFEIGSLKNSTLWSFRFDEFAFDYFLLHGQGDFTASQICHPALLKIQVYDEEHNTELNKTLKAFIDAQYNSSACARNLFINRSSLLKRMERIDQIAKIDLSNLRERMYIELSYLLT